MTVKEIIKIQPKAKESLTYFHIGGCANCAYDSRETLEFVARQFNVPVDLLVKVLNELD